MAVPFILDENAIRSSPVLQMLHFERLLKEILTLLSWSGWTTLPDGPPSNIGAVIQFNNAQQLLDPRVHRSPNPVPRQMPDLVASCPLAPAGENNAVAEAAAATGQNGAVATAPAPVQQNVNAIDPARLPPVRTREEADMRRAAMVRAQNDGGTLADPNVIARAANDASNATRARAANAYATHSAQLANARDVMVRALNSGRLSAEHYATVHAAAIAADAIAARIANDAAARTADGPTARPANAPAARPANAPAARPANAHAARPANAPAARPANGPAANPANAPANAPAARPANAPAARPANAPAARPANAPAARAASAPAANASAARAANAAPVVHAAGAPAAGPRTLTLQVELCADCYYHGNGRRLKVIGVTRLERTTTAAAAAAEGHQHQNHVVPVLVDDADLIHHISAACRNLAQLPSEDQHAERHHDHSLQSRETAGYGSIVAKHLAQTLLNRSTIESSILTAVFVVVGLKMFDRR